MAFSTDVVVLAALGLVAVGCTVEPEETSTSDLSTTSTSTTGEQTDITATTIPLPTATEGSDGESDAGSSGTTSADGTTTTSGTTDGTTTDEPGTDGTTTDEPGTSEGTGGDTWNVGWCVLQYPPSVMVMENEVWTVYVRVFAAGLTDQTGVTDPDPALVVELGYGLDGSDPSMGLGAPWTYVPAMPNGGYGPGAPDYSAANDEYQGDLSIPLAGIYDYAARISGDGGNTWVWCDIDGLTTGGYTPDQAGHAEVSP